KRFDGAIHVAFDDNVKFLEVTDSQTSSDLIQRNMLLGTQALFALQLQALIGYLPCFGFALHFVKLITGSRRTGHPQYLYWRSGPGFVYFLPALIIQCFHFTTV